jgi:hypothetical protein
VRTIARFIATVGFVALVLYLYLESLFGVSRMSHSMDVATMVAHQFRVWAFAQYRRLLTHQPNQESL